MVAIVDYRKIVPHVDNASICDATLTQDLGYIVFLQNNKTLYSINLHDYFTKHHGDIKTSKTIGPTQSLPLDSSKSVDEDLPVYGLQKQSRALPPTRGSAQHRVRWLHKLGLVDKQTNKPPVPKPPWYQVAGTVAVLYLYVGKCSCSVRSWLLLQILQRIFYLKVYNLCQ